MKNNDKTNVLYVIIGGICEGVVESQALQYINEINKTNKFNIHILSHEKKIDYANKEKMKKAEANFKEKNMTWYKVQHIGGPSRLDQFLEMSYAQIRLLILMLFVILRHNIKIVHLRSIQPGFYIWMFKFLGIKIITDTRGNWLRERVDIKIWKENGLMHRWYGLLQEKILLNSDHVFVLNENGMKRMLNQGVSPNDISIVPCCSNQDKFNINEKIKNENKYELIYSGAISTWYDFEKVIEFYEAINEKYNVNMVCLIRNLNDPLIQKMIYEDIFKKFNLEKYNNIKFEKVEFSGIQDYYKKADFGLCCLYNMESKQESCPIKVGEYISCGIIPIMSGVCRGEKLQNEKIGIDITKDKTKQDYVESFKRAIALKNESNKLEELKKYAMNNYSLSYGTKEYLTVYEKLSK